MKTEPLRCGASFPEAHRELICLNCEAKKTAKMPKNLSHGEQRLESSLANTPLELQAQQAIGLDREFHRQLVKDIATEATNHH